MSGPDMTPQGLADAIEGLLGGGPPRTPRRRPAPEAQLRKSANWQRVLLQQVVNTLLEPDDPMLSEDEHRLRRILGHPFDAALAQLRRAQPALAEALASAFDVTPDAWKRADGPGDTETATTPLGRLVVGHLYHRMESGRFPPEATS